MVDDWVTDVRTSYDTVAEGYHQQISGALAGAPDLRAGLAYFADLVHEAGGGPVADVGCGPGHVTAYLRDRGADAFGIDLSPAMIDVARRVHPDLRFEVGDMTALDLTAGSVAGLMACWSLVHTPDGAIPAILGEFRRVIRPGGPLMVGFHAGSGVKHKTEGYGGHPMNVYVYRREPGWMAEQLVGAGFAVTAQMRFGLESAAPSAIVFARG